MPLKDLPPDARPREKLLARGAAALSDTELLALLLRTGTAGRGVLQMARELLDGFGGVAGLLHASAEAVKDYLRLHLAQRPHEVFALLLLDSGHRLIALEELFRGTLAHSSVYPREVVLRALHHHAAAVVLAHNHPSGRVEPSAADQALTERLRAALALVDVCVLDHVIVAPGQALSMAERGLL